MADKETELDVGVFDEFDLETSRQLVILVYDEDTETIEIENPMDLPYPMALGIVSAALDQMRGVGIEGWVMEDDEDEDEDED